MRSMSVLTIGEIIRRKRKAMGLTQRKLAEKAGATPLMVYNWEKGLFFPNVMSLCDLADVFGCSVDELLGRTQGKAKGGAEQC